MVPVEAPAPRSRRAAALLVVFLLGCAAAAALAAVGFGAAWQELYAWALPRLTGG